MRLERDEFLVSYDPAGIDESKIVAEIKKVGYRSYIVKDSDLEEKSQPQTKEKVKIGVDPVFDDAIARAKKERKLIVVDFTATWCVPCKKMSKITFPDPKVAPLLKQCVFLVVDTDKHPALAERFGIVGLPDIRFLTPNGKEIKRLLNFQTPEAFSRVLSVVLEKKH